MGGCENTTIDKVSRDKTIFTNHGEFGGFDQIIWAVGRDPIGGKPHHFFRYTTNIHTSATNGFCLND
jgi:hypothetical protein